MPVVDSHDVPVRAGSSYPAEFRAPVEARQKRALGDAAGLKAYGVNLVELPPGAWSAQRHWHTHEDEFVFVLEGEIVLVTDQGEQPLGAGMAAGFPRGETDGHHLVNRSGRRAVFLEVGDRRNEDAVHYPDVDLHLPNDGHFTNKAGDPY